MVAGRRSIQIGGPMLSPGREKRHLSFCFLFAFILMLFTPAALAAGDVHPLFDLSSTTASPFPSDRFTVFDFHQRTNLRVNLPLPNCTTHPSDCLDVALLNQLDGFNTQPRISVPFDGAIDPATVNSNTVFVIRVADTSNPGIFNPKIIGINQVVWDTLLNNLLVQTN